jgi:hypothetical protein
MSDDDKPSDPPATERPNVENVGKPLIHSDGGAANAEKRDE